MEFLILIFLLVGLGKYASEKTWLGMIVKGLIHFIGRFFTFFFPSLINLFQWNRDGSGAYGTARFANNREKREILNPKHEDGLPLGKSGTKLSLDSCTKHLIMIGASGIGKTTKFLYPALLKAEPTASYVVTDVSGEAFHDTSGWLSAKGFNVKRVNLMDATASHQFNPLSQCQNESDYNKLAELLVSSSQQNESGTSNSGFWTDSAKMVLSTIMKALVRHPDQSVHNLHNLRHLVNQLSIDKQSLDGFMSMHSTTEIFDDYLGIISQDAEVFSNILSTAKVSLKAMGDPALRDVTAGSHIDFAELRRTPTVLFISYNVEDTSYLRFLLSIFWLQTLNSFTKVDLRNASYLPIYAMLDEFQNLSRIPSFENSIAVLRKYKVSLFLMLQGLDGLNIYGRADKIILGNCKSKIFTSGLSQTDTELISKMLGTTTMKYESPNAGHLSREDRIKGVREIQRPLLHPDEVRMIPENQCIMIHGSQKPMILDLEPYYENKELSKRSALPPIALDYTSGRTQVKYIDLSIYTNP